MQANERMDERLAQCSSRRFHSHSTECGLARRRQMAYLNDREDDFVIQMNLGRLVQNFAEVEEHPRISVPALDETIAILKNGG